MNTTNGLYEKMNHLQWLLRKQQMHGYAERGPMADTSRGQGRILAILKLRDGVSTKDLAYLLGVRVSSLNELLAKLEKNGFLTREPSEEDKRVMLCKLTDKGRQEKQPEQPSVGSAFSCLTAEEQEQLAALLDRVIDSLPEDSEEDEDGEMCERMARLREHYGDIPGMGFGGNWRGGHGRDWRDLEERLHGHGGRPGRGERPERGDFREYRDFCGRGGNRRDFGRFDGR